MSQNQSYIVAARRTPMGGLQGELASMSAPELGAVAIRAAIADARIDPQHIDEAILGNVLPAGIGQAPARQAARAAGIPDGAGATTINKVCGSGMKAVMLAHDLLRVGTNDVMVAGGMESMSRAPYLLQKARGGYRMGHDRILDSMFLDGLEDAETGRSMGSFAQETADEHQLSRQDMDAWAIQSLRRAVQADDAGWLQAEMAPVEVTERRKARTISADEQPRKADLDRIPTLRAAFAEGGTITAANASSISDGASALLLANAAGLEHCQGEPLARIVGHATFSQHPSRFTLSPIGAISALFAQLGWTQSDVDLYEINEAFAMVSMIAVTELGLDAERVNVAGGACAQGHPIGSTGARLIVTLSHALRRMGGRRGIACLCIGGGEATAVAIEVD